MRFHPCIVVPHFDHAGPLAQTLSDIGQHSIPIILVDDGSPAAAVEQVSSMIQSMEGVSAVFLTSNGGKGAAVVAGLREAWKLGYTHALQVDADGQHDLSLLKAMLDQSRDNPAAMIATRPEYDESAPLSRRLGRKLTNFMVAVETLGTSLPDVMCGFRVYPLRVIVPLLGMQKMGQRMDFDIEILVRAAWQGIAIRYLAVGVAYPPDGVSHFRLFLDNALISMKHIQLLLGMVLRLPFLLRNGRAFRTKVEVSLG